MKKQKKLKPKRRPDGDTSMTNVATDTKKQAKERASFPAKLWHGWQLAWAILGPIVALTSFLFLITPQVSIDPSINLNPSDPFATHFLITNRGRVPILDVAFGCGIGGKVAIQSLILQAPGPSVPRIKAGDAVTRNCLIRDANLQGRPTIFIVVRYRWPIIRLADEKIARFILRRGTSGFFLVPDTAL